jgi:hypothetical protein
MAGMKKRRTGGVARVLLTPQSRSDAKPDSKYDPVPTAVFNIQKDMSGGGCL